MRSCGRERLDRHQPRQLGRARPRPRRVAQLLGRTLRRGSGVPERRRALRPPPPRRRRGARRRASPVPHRNGHRLAGPSRRAHDRPRLLRAGDRAGAASRRGCRGRGGVRVAELYEAPEALGRGRFDLVYTGIGALCWLPDIRRWGQVVADLLRPGGRLFIREGHPFSGRSTSAAPTGCWLSSAPTSSRRSRSSGTRAARTSRPTRSSRRPSPTRGTTGSARSSPRCSTPGWS